MTRSCPFRRDYLRGIAAISLIATSGCASPYGFGELNAVAQTIAQDLTEHTPYDYRADENGNEDPGNEVYLGWSEGMLNVSVDAEFAESEFCNEEYSNKELQQDPDRMEQEKTKAFDALLTENSYLSDIYFYAFRDTMRDLEPKENTAYYAFRLDFGNGSIWNEYQAGKAHQLYESLVGSGDPKQTATEQLRNNGRFGCAPPDDMPRPPETNETT